MVAFAVHKLGDSETSLHCLPKLFAVQPVGKLRDLHGKQIGPSRPRQPDHDQPHICDPRHLDLFGGSMREVNDAVGDKRPTIVDTYLKLSGV